MMTGQHMKRQCCLRVYKGNEVISDRNGFGNWSEIATFIGSNKTREDIEEHYHKLFLQ